MRKPLVILAAFLAFGLSGCGYNTFQTTDEQVKAGWAEVTNQYQREGPGVPAHRHQRCSLTMTVAGAEDLLLHIQQ